ncbi:FGGY family carbohydrate kinase [Galbibacter sp. EGI 63066]|uniref:xylulokinase n=1 Tax=Galbibacter sp. EGI 63066 TaxID=2993559 RepID=UPI00224956E0|nr:FGGY family carbohydrate kinase [Galbibacter sp. EGI 63066]MCX2680252.1 FGGY family carbohydrate kinase [Galbibacter sp. EGI 63066]
MFSIGYDIGSSSIKAALIDQKDGRVVAKTQYPEKEMPITSLKIGWGEQDPEMWWENVCKATQKLLQLSKINANEIKSIGISYQMHGLVLVDKDLNVLRPSIIWCDSRAVETGNGLFLKNKERSIDTLLNSPGNFTLSKLKWVKDNEPEIYKKIYKYMLPGDYIAMKLSGDCVTTPSGLSEGITWDFKSDAPAYWLLESAGIDSELIPEIKPTFSEQGTVNSEGAKASGLPEGIPISYRAGDQPNNAMSLNVFNPGEIAATGGTSGVVYAISDKGSTQESTRINSFAHVNHTAKAPRIGKLLNINGAGIQYSWIRNQLTDGMSYGKMNGFAEEVPVGSEGLKILPFGNGAERMLGNKSNGAQVSNLNFNIHRKGHIFRAALEGIAFSMVYGMEILANDNVKVTSIKAGGDNLFRSEIFSSTISTLTKSDINIVETTGAVGAARASAYALGVFKTFDEAVATDEIKQTYTPEQNKQAYEEAYGAWKEELTRYINRFN